MSELSDPPESRPFASYPRMSLAAMACLVWLALYIPVGVLAYLHVLAPLQDWVDRQGWLIQNVGPFFVWISYLIVVALGVAMTQHIWRYIVGSYEEPPPEPTATPGRICPQCGSESKWDGRKCAQCDFTHNPWKKGATSNG